MKTLTFKFLGFTSSLLVTAGLLGAAERLDPLTHSAAKQPATASSLEGAASNCTTMCWYYEGAVKEAKDQQS